MRSLLLLLSTCLLLGLAGCGQKGPLTLPSDDATQAHGPATPSTAGKAPENDSQEEDERENR